MHSSRTVWFYPRVMDARSSMERYSPGAPPGVAPAPVGSPPPPRSRPVTSSRNDPDRSSAEPEEPEPSRPEDDPLVLDEIDRIISELSTKRGDRAAPESPPARDGSIRGDGVAYWGRDERGTAPSGFFEEHLEAARRAVGHVHETVGELQSTSEQLRQRLASVETELDRITREFQFVQERSNAPGPTVPEASTVPPWSEEDLIPPSPRQPVDSSDIFSGSFTAIRAAAADSPAPVYETFTVDRYNRTIDSLKDSRTKLVAWTLLLSAAVGIVLVLVVLYSPVVNPPVWIAALPLVWVVPIPYFLLSFRGTHRVLERNHLNLPEAK